VTKFNGTIPTISPWNVSVTNQVCFLQQQYKEEKTIIIITINCNYQQETINKKLSTTIDDQGSTISHPLSNPCKSPSFHFTF
jgi:hypothetical protein